jgi:BirA family biotin operon repressor/biotin-[acetyl-CoA-carboxylase] ligase
MSGKRPDSSAGTSPCNGGVSTPVAYRVLEVLGTQRARRAPVERLAEGLSCRPDDIRVAIDAIRRLGYSVSDRPGEGYRLDTDADVIVRSDLLRCLRTRALGRSTECFLKLESTNALAMRAALAGARHGTAVVAEHQTAGRGRLGRAWFSPPGVGLWFSLILRYELELSRAWMLTLGAAAGVAEAVEASSGVCPEVRWPNDLYLNGRKLAGILTEARVGVGGLRFAVLGVGINVNHEEPDFPAGLQDTATSLRCGTGREHGRTRLLAEIFLALERTYRGLDAERIMASWKSRARMPGGPVRVKTAEGPVTGVAEDVDTDGALLIRDVDGGTTRITMGDVGGEATR